MTLLARSKVAWLVATGILSSLARATTPSRWSEGMGGRTPASPLMPSPILVPGERGARRVIFARPVRRAGFSPGRLVAGSRLVVHRFFSDSVLAPLWLERRHWSDSMGPGVEREMTVTKTPGAGAGSLLFADGLLNVQQPDWVPAGAVKPRFRESWNANVTYRWHLNNLWLRPALRASLGFSDNVYWGYEIGIETAPLSLSLFDEAPYPGIRTNAYRYLDKLVQMEVKAPLGRVSPYAGAKSHLREKDLWLRAGLRFALNEQSSLDVGVDIFAGPPGTYFWGWRATNRAFSVFTLSL